MRKCGWMLNGWAGRRCQYGTCALHAGYLRLQKHTQIVYYCLFFHHNISGCTDRPYCYVVCTSPVSYLLLELRCRGIGGAHATVHIHNAKISMRLVTSNFKNEKCRQQCLSAWHLAAHILLFNSDIPSYSSADTYERISETVRRHYQFSLQK